MTFQKSVDLQITLMNWINKNLKPVKRFNVTYGRSKWLWRLAQRDIPEATHEDFKQAMARAGYFADCQFTNDTYSVICFNVSRKSVQKLRERQEKGR